MAGAYAGPLPGSYWVQEASALAGRLLAGPYPGSPVPDVMQARLRALLDAGVTCFVDLTQSHEREAYSPLLPEGVQYQRFPIPDFTVPPDDQMMDILDTLDRLLADGHTIYLHCWGGVGRTGTTVGCFWVRHGMPGIEALEEITRRRRHDDSPDTDDQRQLVIRWNEVEEKHRR